MYSPTTRLLTLLEVLQSKASVSGPELAARLEVNVRSVRRYVTMLRDMGIPVESDPGRYGTYYLRPGFRLPPLMFNGGEILAIILGLMSVRHLGLSGGVESAVAKIERVLPDELHERAQALQNVLSFNLRPPQAASEEMLTRLSLAAYQHNQVWLDYGDSRRVVDVYGLVYHNRFWYAVGHCHLRDDLRIFRLDRVRELRVLETTFTPITDFDPVSYLLTKIANISRPWDVEVLLKTTLQDAQGRIARDVAVLEEVPDGVLLRMRVEDLMWTARYIVRLECPFTVIQPPELREALRRLAQEILQMVDQVMPAGSP